MTAFESAPALPAENVTAEERLGALVAELSAKLADAISKLDEANETITRLKNEILLLKHWRFGRRSEKTGAEATGSLFEGMGLEALEEIARVSEDAAPQEAIPDTKKKGHGRRALPGDLPVERVVVEPKPEEKVCAPCGTEKISIGEEIRRELDYTPGTIFVREYARPIYACPQECESQVVVAPPPPAPIEKGLPGPGLLARVVVDKYADHLPLARQVARFERDGLSISRQTLCDWCAGAADLLTTFNELLRREVLLSKVIHTDDTPVTWLESKKNIPRTGYLWAYRGDRHHPYVFYEFSPNHQRTWPANVLAGWKGHLQADAYKGYDALYADGDIIEVACWAHARRKFKNAEPSDGKRTSPILRRIGALYAIEKSIREEAAGKGLDFSAPGEKGDQAEALRKDRRMKESVPALETLKRELDALMQLARPKSPLGEAVAYALGNWKALTVYAGDGALAIDNNAGERDIRPITVGRKNYLFYGSERGGDTAATLYGVLNSAKRHAAKTWEYMRDLFRRLPTMKVNELPSLLPDRWVKDPDNAD